MLVGVELDGLPRVMAGDLGVPAHDGFADR